MNRSLLSVFVGLSLFLLASCGFHLRGSATLPDSLKTMYVQGVNLQQGLGLELKRTLTRNGVTVVSDYQQGTAVLTVTENKVERRVLSVGSDAKVSEYGLHGLITFNVSDGQGQVLTKSQQVEAQRDYRFDQEQVLGKDEEERLLREQLDQQLVQGILRRLSALK
ncbi:MAG: LPS assembly lipoprotein LptE [Gammaproteobacteria bacterium]|nr:LPS assembly lipoprotein LptE [Gammaproteobacteria bacterium]MDH5591983.1 LPS assembly lipoprotein LptE [Gammaproteobacteria bacterium]